MTQIEDSHVFETYLQINNFEHRRAITKIRTSSRTLQIETGRWNNVSQNLCICEKSILNEVGKGKPFFVPMPNAHCGKTKILQLC